MAVLAGCQSDDTAGALDLSPGQQPPQGQVLASELRAYCPPVQVREGTSFFNTYERGGQDDANRIIYQASIADVTRTCTYNGGTTVVNIAVAGRIVPGPKGRAGSVTMPIRVAMLRDGQVGYSELFQHQVTVADTIGATQFVFMNGAISVPSDARNIAIYAGYDEGPAARRR
jgi:hypothetical protein